MGEYANVKSKQFVRTLKKLVRKYKVELADGGNHNYVITCIHNAKSYPIASSHREMNKHIVKNFGEWLVKNEVCTKEQYDELL